MYFKGWIFVTFELQRNFKGFENLTFDFQSFQKKILWNSKVFQRIRNLWLIKIKFEERIGIIEVFLLQCNKGRWLNLWCSKGSIRDIQIRNPFVGLMLGVSRMKETVILVMVLCIFVTFENWFFSCEIKRFTWIDLWTSKEKQRKLPGPLKLTQRRPKIATFDNSNVTIQRFVEV